MIIINESGLYSLLFQMQPQKAKGVSQNEELIEKRIQKLKRFKHWVTSEVLPSIRKHGIYATDNVIDEFGTIRTVQMNGEIYFVGKDVAIALGYSNTRDAIAKHV